MAKRQFLPTLFTGGGGSQREQAIGHVLAGTPIWDGIGTVYSDFDTGWDFDSAVRRGLQRNIWVFRCIDVIATAQARLPIVFRKGDPITGETYDDPVLKLLNRRPNSYEDAAMFRYRLSAQLLLSKRGAFIEPVFNNGGRIGELHLIPPDVVTPIPDEKTFIRGYQIEGKYRWGLDEVPPEKLIWVRLKPHPQKPYEQMTPLMTAELSIDTDFMARLYNRNYLGNGGKNGLLILFQGLMGMTDAEEIRARFEGGPGQAGRPTVVEGAGISVQDLGATPHDAQWLEAIAGSKKEILEAFGVPESLLGDASGRTFDNADAEAENFWTNTEMGHCDAIARGLDPLTGNIQDDNFAAFDYASVDVLQRQKQRRQEKAKADWEAGLITWDEYREECGKEVWNTPESRSAYITVTGKAAISKDPKDMEQAGEMTPIGQPSLEDQQAMMMGQQQAQLGAQSALAQSQFANQAAQRRFDNDLAAREFGGGRASGFGGGSRPGFGAGPSRFGTGQGGYSQFRPQPAQAKALTGSIEPVEEKWLLDLMAQAIEDEAASLIPETKGVAPPTQRRPVEIVDAEVVEPGGDHPFARDLDVYEAEVGGIVDRWNDEQGEICAERVMHVKVRKHTRHWSNVDGSMAGVGTKALNPAYIVDVERWAENLGSTLRRRLERMADREARRAARDMDVSGFVKLMQARGLGIGDPDGKTHIQRVFGTHAVMDQMVKDVVDPLEELVKHAARRQSQRVIARIQQMDRDGAKAKEIQKQIRKMTGARGGWRKTLARFLVTSTVEHMRHATYGLAGRLLSKTWNTVGDERVRPAHIAADQQQRPVGVNFRVGGFWMMYPGDPKAPVHLTINCRCWLEYQVADRWGSLFDDVVAESGAAKR